MKTRSRLIVFCVLGVAGCAEQHHSFAADQSVASDGLVVLLPGVTNLERELSGLRKLIEAEHPSWEIDARPWGPPLLSMYNLAAYRKNLATARTRAAELAAYRKERPHARITVVGYSGGGGIAVLIVAALPTDVQIDRLVLIAPAISPDYPLEKRVLPHVREFVVNYASQRDLQVGWGTNNFGTIDRVDSPSAGYEGFKVDDPEKLNDRLLQVHWEESVKPTGHQGNHLGYLAPDWQKQYLLPALALETSAEEFRERVHSATQR